MPWGVAAAAVGAAGAIGAASISSSASSNAANAATSAADLQAQIAQDQWNTYKSTYLPLQQQTVADAQNYASPANYEKAAGDAESSVQQQFDSQKASLARTPGMDPSSGAYQAGMTSLGLQEAATGATAQNAARTNVQNTAFTRELNAQGMGSTVANSASSAANSAANTSMGLSNMQYGRANSTASGVGNMISGVANGVGNWATSGSSWSPTSTTFNTGSFSAPTDNSYGVSSAGLSGVGYSVPAWTG